MKEIDTTKELAKWMEAVNNVLIAQGKAIEILAYAAPYHTQQALSEAYESLDTGSIIKDFWRQK